MKKKKKERKNENKNKNNSNTARDIFAGLFLTSRTKFNLDSISPDEEEHPWLEENLTLLYSCKDVKIFLGHKTSRGGRNEGACKTHKISIPPW